MNGLYAIAFWGMVEPSILGPFDSHEERLEASKKWMTENGNDTNCIAKLDIVDGVPQTSPFTNIEWDGE